MAAKKNMAGYIVAFGIVGVFIALGVWFKNNLASIAGKAAGEAVNEVTHNNDISLKDALRNTGAQVLTGASDAIHEKSQDAVNNWIDKVFKKSRA